MNIVCFQQGAKEGLTNGVDQSPTQPKNLNCIHSKQKVASAGGNANGRYRPRFFDQVRYQTTYKSMGKEAFFH